MCVMLSSLRPVHSTDAMCMTSKMSKFLGSSQSDRVQVYPSVALHCNKLSMHGQCNTMLGLALCCECLKLMNSYI